jgi:predicted O-methyltransferase YrrM
VNLRRVAVLATTIAAAVTVVAAAADAPHLALSGLGFAVWGVLGYLVLSMRSLGGAVATATRTADRARREARRATRVGESAPRSRRAQRDSDDDTVPELREIVRGQVGILNAIDRVPGLTAEMIRVYDRLVAHPHPMPEFGGWAATPSTMLWILDHLSSKPVRTIVECGSGASTVWIATALERRGGDGRVVALESSNHYAMLTRAELKRLGLSERATIVHAPLVDTRISDGFSQPWFDLSGLELSEPIDLLFVDGPPSRVAREARYPAFPVLANQLAPDAVVILDDTGRPAEDAIVERWSSEVHGGRTLEVCRTVDRSTVLAARSA